MSPLYIYLFPLFALMLYRSSVQISASIKDKNYGKLKVDVFFLVLIVLLIIGLIYTIQNIK